MAAQQQVAHPPLRLADLSDRASLRITGVLTTDAQICPTAGRPAHALLMLHLKPAKGLPYAARVDLGADVADHMAAEADLVLMRTGALVSLAGDWLELQHDHGHAVLRVVNARDVVAFAHPINPTPRGD